MSNSLPQLDLNKNVAISTLGSREGKWAKTDELRFVQTKGEKDRIKVELWYETQKGTHVSSEMLKTMADFEGPFIESIHVVMPPDKTFTIIEAYWDIFEELRDSHLVPSDATLVSFDILLEDSPVLAWEPLVKD